MSNSTIDIYTYTCSDEGILLPAINEYTWHIGVRAFLYLLAMLWCFLGMAIVADTFMCGIEKITSKTRIIQIPEPQNKDGVREVEVKVWNDTVANLSLMAFGTSAPEILLSVIEITGKGFKAGDLGPGTIVGSAAFNLFIITAICLLSIPSGETRRIKEIGVYGVTTFFSIFAYVWLIIVLILISPGRVDIWEAVVTFLMFPVLILTSYGVDKGCGCRKKNKTSSEVEIGIDFTNVDEKGETDNDGTADIIHLARELGKNKDLSEEDAAKLAAAKLQENQHHSSLWYRIHATRGITGGHRLVPKVNKTLQELYLNVTDKIAQQNEMGSRQSLSMVDLSEGGSKAVIEFTASCCAVMENEGHVNIGIKRYGLLKVPVNVMVETIDGTAEAGSDYQPVKQKIHFDENERSKDLKIQIVDDNEWEPDEIFFVKLWLDEVRDDVTLGKISINQITIINDDEPGTLSWSKPSYIVNETAGKAQLFVNRVNGADGTISVGWKTKDLTAISGKDYIGGEGTLTFEHGETSKTLDITILDPGMPERDHNFQVELRAPNGGAGLGKVEKAIVTLVNDDEFEGLVSRIANQTKKNLDSLRLDTSSWGEQFHEAMNVNGGDTDNATRIDYFMHFCTFFWKTIFAFIPPPSIGGGWLTFIFSLVMIAMLTAVVGDLASIFGCLIGLEKTVTAITLVALGTSMPDTFASKSAAVNEKTADNSIGNINGSNAVNVFLGLGLPWMIASIYWESKNQPFNVPEGALVFSVVLYTSFAVLCCVILMLRRRLKLFGNAELGGPMGPKVGCAIFIGFLWIIYVILSALNAYDIIIVNF